MIDEKKAIPRASLKALGRVNLSLIDIIHDQAPGSVAELSLIAGMPQPNVSRALAALESAGIIQLQGQRPKRPVLISRYAVIDLISS